MIYFRPKNPLEEENCDAVQGLEKALFLTSRCVNCHKAVSKRTRCPSAMGHPDPHPSPLVHPSNSGGEKIAETPGGGAGRPVGCSVSSKRELIPQPGPSSRHPWSVLSAPENPGRTCFLTATQWKVKRRAESNGHRLGCPLVSLQEACH